MFSGPANAAGGRVAALCVPGGATISRGEIDAYTEYLRGLGAKGLAWVKVNELGTGAEGLQSPIVKFFSSAAMDQILSRTKAKSGESFSSARQGGPQRHLGALRQKTARTRPVERAAAGGWSDSRVRIRRGGEGVDGAPTSSQPQGRPRTFIEAERRRPTQGYDLVLNGGVAAARFAFTARSPAAGFRALKISRKDQQAKFGLCCRNAEGSRRRRHSLRLDRWSR